MFTSFWKRLYRWYLRAPEHRGKLPFSRWLGSKLFSEQGAVFEVERGIRMYLHPKDWIEFVLLKSGSYEPLTLTFIEKNLRPGQRALLAGVNNGLHVIVAARCVLKSGMVIGVEPQPRSLYRAYKNILLNGLEAEVRLVPAALGKSPGSMPMADAPIDNSATASLFDAPGRTAFQVIVQTIPDVLRNMDVPGLDLILLDVEGYELDVLGGLSKECLPPLLIVEVNPPLLKSAGVEQAAVYRALISLGYSCWNLLGIPAKPDDIVPEQNIVAVLGGSNPPIWADESSCKVLGRE